MGMKERLKQSSVYRWVVDLIYTVIINPYRSLQIRSRHKKLSGSDEKEIFKDIYASNTWGDNESASGTGSSLKATDHLRVELPELLKKYSIQSMLDLPSGDFNWMQSLDLTNIQYTGADIVPDIVARNKSFENDHRAFVQLNLISDPLPVCDLILVRDCLVHLPFAQALEAITNIKKSGIRYLLATHFQDMQNKDISMGQWRPLNLCAVPFSFPAPIELISEKLSGKYRSKSLALWRVKDI